MRHLVNAFAVFGVIMAALLLLGWAQGTVHFTVTW